MKLVKKIHCPFGYISLDENQIIKKLRQLQMKEKIEI